MKKKQGGSKAKQGDQVTRDAVVHALAQFRYRLRRFHRFSEQAARSCGVTPQQHQLMLGVAGFTGRGCANISELAEFLQEKHHSVVGLVERAVRSGLVRRAQDSADRRVVIVSLTPLGKRILAKLTELHRHEVKEIPAVLRALDADEEFSSGRGE